MAAREGFEERLQEVLAGEELEQKMEAFMSKNAVRVLNSIELGESKGHEGEFEGGEFTHDAYK